MANGTCLTATDTTHPCCRATVQQSTQTACIASPESFHYLTAPCSIITRSTQTLSLAIIIYRSSPETLLKQQLGVTGAASSTPEQNCSHLSRMLPTVTSLQNRTTAHRWPFHKGKQNICRRELVTERARQRLLNSVVQSATICDQATGQGLFSSTTTCRGKQR